MIDEKSGFHLFLDLKSFLLFNSSVAKIFSKHFYFTRVSIL